VIKYYLEASRQVGGTQSNSDAQSSSGAMARHQSHCGLTENYSAIGYVQNLHKTDW